MDLLTWSLLAFAGASAAYGAGRKLIERRRARRILRAQPLLQRETPEGTVVRVTGIVRAIAPLIAPLSERPCVVVRARVEIRGPIGSILPERLHEVIEIAPFLLEREREPPVRVDGEHARLDLPSVALDRIDGACADRFLLRHGVPLHEAPRARFEETLVEPGMRITVAGLVMFDPAAAPATDERSFRDGPPITLRLTGNVDHPLAIGEAAPALAPAGAVAPEPPA